MNTPNNARDIIFFIGAGFSKILATLPLKRIWVLAVEDEVVFVIGT
jgi:hypothetical protein